MRLNEFQDLSKRTLPKGKEGENLANYGLGLSGESGEVVDHIKKHVFHGHEMDTEKVMEELGDVLRYVAGLSTMCGFTLEEVATANITKLQKRFPKGFSREASIKRIDVREGD